MLTQSKTNVNNKLTWINFLHWYQPANVDGHVIKEATEMSYLRLVRALEEHAKIKFTINITGCLILRWEECKYFDLIKRIRNLVKKGQIELTGSAAYHPILPLISEKEAIRQVRENEDILRYFIDKKFKPNGFFLPELVYSSKSAKLIKRLGYKWLLLDEIAYSGKFSSCATPYATSYATSYAKASEVKKASATATSVAKAMDVKKAPTDAEALVDKTADKPADKNEVDFDKVYYDKGSKMKIVFRSRKYSKCYVPNFLRDEIKKKSHEDLYITATDAELYGLRHIDHTAVFEKLLKNRKLNTLTISEFISQHKAVEKIKPLACSWESTEKELKQGKPYILWYDKDNDIQQKLWQFANLAYQTVEKHKKDNSYGWARWHLVRGLASCTFWWASAKDFRLFGPISWSPDEIERGSNELIRATRALEDVTTREVKIQAEKLYIKIKQMVWKKHWRYYWKK